MDFYLILQSIMDEKGLRIPDIARKCGLSDGTIRSAIVRKQKNVSLDVAFKLSDGLDVSLERLNGMPEKVLTPVEPEDNKENASPVWLMGYDVDKFKPEEKEPIPVSEDGLDEEEKQLLGAIRGLTPVQQEALVAFLKTVLEQDQ